MALRRSPAAFGPPPSHSLVLSASQCLAAALRPARRKQVALGLAAARAQSPSRLRTQSAASSVSRTLAGVPNPEGGEGELASFLLPNGEGEPDQEKAVPDLRDSILDKGVRVELVSIGTPQAVED